MVAGRAVLEQYLSNQVDDETEVYPAAIFAKVMALDVVEPGKPLNTYPEKVSSVKLDLFMCPRVSEDHICYLA